MSHLAIEESTLSLASSLQSLSDKLNHQGVPGDIRSHGSRIHVVVFEGDLLNNQREVSGTMRIERLCRLPAEKGLIDYFDPFEVKQHGSCVNRYGCFFSLLNFTRADEEWKKD